MKQGARCLGRRCDMIAKKALEDAADGTAHEKKLILDAQKACHAGSGTVENEYEEKRHDGAHPENVWTPGDVYHGYNSSGHAGPDYHKIIPDARTPIGSRLPDDPKMAPEKSLDDMEAEAIKIDQARDAANKAKAKAAKDKTNDKLNKDAKKEEAKVKDAAKKDQKTEELAKAKADGDKKADAADSKKEDKKDVKKDEKKTEDKEEKKDTKKEDKKAEAKDAKPEAKEEKKPEDKKEEKKPAAAAEEKKPDAAAPKAGDKKDAKGLTGIPELDAAAAAASGTAAGLNQKKSAPKATAPVVVKATPVVAAPIPAPAAKAVAIAPAAKAAAPSAPQSAAPAKLEPKTKAPEIAKSGGLPGKATVTGVVTGVVPAAQAVANSRN